MRWRAARSGAKSLLRPASAEDGDVSCWANGQGTPRGHQPWLDGKTYQEMEAFSYGSNGKMVERIGAFSSGADCQQVVWWNGHGPTHDEVVEEWPENPAVWNLHTMSRAPQSLTTLWWLSILVEMFTLFVPTRWCPSSLAKLVNITPVSLCFFGVKYL